MFNYHSPIPWGSFRGRQEEKWGSLRGRFVDHFRVGDHFGGCTGEEQMWHDAFEHVSRTSYTVNPVVPLLLASSNKN